jgi:phosphopantothenoylcysteine decarboxylase/phosphopantothenate--cysteine ligase
MLKGKKILVTAGPTYEPIDPVRFLGNRSSGKMGFAIAEELRKREAEVYLVAGPVNLSCHEDILRYDVESSCQMFDRCVSIFPNCDAVVMAAAVADYQPAEVAKKKMKKNPDTDEMVIRLKKTKDILAHLSFLKKKDQVMVGFSSKHMTRKPMPLKSLKKNNWILLC